MYADWQLEASNRSRINSILKAMITIDQMQLR